MKRICHISFLLVFFLIACGGQSENPDVKTPEEEANLIPEEFQAAYHDMDSTLDEFIASQPKTGGQAPVFAAGLSYANGNAGESLLNPEIPALVHKQLDALLSMGVQGVVIAIPIPILEPDFPRSDEFLEFFKQVAEDVSAHNMQLLVECGPIFSGTIFSPARVDWSKYTKASFIQARKNQLLTIATEIKPDILQIANEPSTTTLLTGFDLTPEEFTDFVQSSIDLIDKSSGIQISAGAGTWEDPAYMNGLTQIDKLDTIDIHIYPIGRNAMLLHRAMETATLAVTRGKRVGISEAWLYKVDSDELGEVGGEFEMIYSRDAYSFFEPLDEKFIRALTLMARANEIEWISFFWTRNFFVYLDYETYHTRSDQQINQALNQASFTAIDNGTFSALGDFYKNWIIEQNQ
ncbi:MAG: hypothetical protein KKF30_18310 [Proteobacteria bacterium]|nr:hypothetical protein [Pseudomonadota bacterium]MBU4469799.1 hypothetical protein [Pseudomonadota bacterium]MCG2753034.1 hypothetical protein [Desulfobacteraceae bacterium]